MMTITCFGLVDGLVPTTITIVDNGGPLPPTRPGRANGRDLSVYDGTSDRLGEPVTP